jgi:transglycosylase-like protein with SLT domain
VVDVEFATDPRHARTAAHGRRRRRRRPSTGRPALAAIGVALMIVATAGTAAPEHGAAVVQRTPRPAAPKPAMPPAVSGADGGMVPTVPPPAVPSPPMAVAPAQPVGGGGAVTVSYVGGIPAVVLSAYRDAAAQLAQSQPGCHLPVPLLAAIGKVESGQARGGRVDANGTAVPPILGPVLNGAGFAAIPDTDHGALDGDPVWDRAVGPMQFIPSTWRRWAADGNHDGIADPENIYDASLAAGHYLCAGGRDLSTAGGVQSAILSYNYSDAYLRLVSAWLVAYQGGIAEVAVVVTPGTPATGTPTTTPPPATGTPATTTTTTVPPTTTTPNPPPVSTTTAPPTTPVTTTTVPSTPPPPVQSLVCDLQNTLGGLLGLLAPPPPECTPTTEPAAPTTH